MIGFVQNLNVTGSMAEHEMTCFYAEKDFANLYEEQVSGIPVKTADVVFDDVELHFVQTDSDVKTKDNIEDKTNLTQKRERFPGKKNAFLEFEPSKESDVYIEQVNSMNYSWKANECMLTKDHEKYDAEKCSPETEHHHDSPAISLA